MCFLNQIGLVSVCAKFQLSSWLLHVSETTVPRATVPWATVPWATVARATLTRATARILECDIRKPLTGQREVGSIPPAGKLSL